MSEPPCAFLNTGAHLIFDYDISEVIRKIAHGNPAPLLLHVPGSAGLLGYNL